MTKKGIILSVLVLMSLSFGQLGAEVVFSNRTVSGESKITKYQKTPLTKKQKIQAFTEERTVLKEKLKKLSDQSEANKKEIYSLGVRISVAKMNIISNPDLYRSLVLMLNKVKSSQKKVLEQIKEVEVRIRTIEKWLKSNNIIFNK